MGDLAADTELVAVGDDTWERTLVRDWEVWGPNGGYMAALALRAAQQRCARARPANATVHFLSAASFDAPVTITAHTQRATRQATSVAVRIDQAGKPILTAMVWAVDAGLDGLEHDDAPPPHPAVWRELPTLDERAAAAGVDVTSRYPFWDNFEQRPVTWIADWENRTLDRPLYQQWLRFTSGIPPTDPWLQAARLLLLVDLGAWPSIGRQHRTEQWMAPTIDVSCEFHRPGTGDEWFFLQGESPHASDGLIASHQHVWNDQGQLLASGISHLLCRRIA